MPNPCPHLLHEPCLWMGRTRVLIATPPGGGAPYKNSKQLAPERGPDRPDSASCGATAFHTPLLPLDCNSSSSELEVGLAVFAPPRSASNS